MRVACASAAGSPVVSITVGAPCPRGPVLDRVEQLAVAAPRHVLRPHLEREVAPGGHGVGGQDPGPGGGGGQRGRQPDGASAEDDGLLAVRDARPAQGVHRDRHGLDKGGRLGAEVADAEDLGHRDGQQLLEPAVAVDPHQVQRHARVRAAGAARVTAPASPQRPHGYPVPGPHAAGAVPAQLLDDGGELVPLDPREEGTGAGQGAGIARVEVQVRTADADGLRPNDDIPRAGRSRFRHLIDNHHARGLGHGCQHLRWSLPPAGAAKSAGQGRCARLMRRIAPSGRPGNDVSPQTGRRLPGSRHKTVKPGPGKGTSTARNLTIILPGVLQKVVYLPGAGHGSASRLARAGSRTAGSAPSAGRCPAAAFRRRPRPICMTITASGYGELMK